MVNKIKIVTALAVFGLINVLSVQNISAQETKKEFGVELGGWIRTDMYWDTRATSGARESMLCFIPKNEDLNEQGKDINATPSFYWGCMASRVNAKITSPDFVRANVSGFVEAEFIGQANDQTNVLRMRHAYVNLDWGQSKLLVGQTWHPMLLMESIPMSVSGNAGAPIGLLVRSPQARFTQNLSKTFSLQATAYTERDLMSTGPLGGPLGSPSVDYQKNSLIPSVNLLFKHKSMDNKFTVGASGGLKTIKPYSMNLTGLETEGTLSTFTANVFMGSEVGDFSIRLNGYYGGNMTDMLMLGGYAVKSETQHPEKMEYEYTPFNNLSILADFGYTIHKNAKVGILGGINMNLGTPDEISSANRCFYSPYFGGEPIDKVIRVAPRFTYQAGKVQFAAEVEYTQASYGKDKELSGDLWKGKWSSTTDVSNIRFLFVTTLFF